MFDFQMYGTRTYVVREYLNRDTICMVAREGKRAIWSVYDGTYHPRELQGEIASFGSRKEAYDFVVEHYGPDYPVVAKDKWGDDGYPIYHKRFAQGYDVPIGWVRKINTKKLGVFIDSIGDEPCFVGASRKACVEALQTSEMTHVVAASKVESPPRQVDKIADAGEEPHATNEGYSIVRYILITLFILASLYALSLNV